jgi:membrane-associated HD superfamily phosphohydrolase
LPHEKTIFYKDELTKAQRRLVKSFPKYYKIEKSPEQKEEKKKEKKDKKYKKVLKNIYSKDYNEDEKYIKNVERYRRHINAIKDTHCYKDPMKRLMRISKETESELNTLELIEKNRDFDIDPLFDADRYRRRPGGMALLKQIEMELQSRLVVDDKDYKDNIILKHYKKRRKKSKKKKKKELESILQLDD